MRLRKSLLIICTIIVALNLSFISKAFTVEIFKDSLNNHSQLTEVLNLQNYYSDILKGKEMNVLNRDHDFKLINTKGNFIIGFCIAYMILQILIFYIIYYWQGKIVRNSKENLTIQHSLIQYQQNEYKQILNTINYQRLINKMAYEPQLVHIFPKNKELNKNGGEMEYQNILNEENDNENKDQVENIIADNEFVFEQESFYDNFETYTNDVSAGFINWLTETYPDFSTDELQLCILLRMGLKTKEICNITFQSLNKIKSTETKLRNRLNIKDSVLSLSSFLYHSYLESKIGQVLIIV